MPNIWEIYVWICVDMYRLIYLSILLSAVFGTIVMQCEGIAACNEEVQDSDHLRSADIVITNVLEDGTFLTQSRENMNTCYGDSGGPITHDGKVIGVVSTGEVGDCRGFDIQGPVFTLLDWINKTKATM